MKRRALHLSTLLLLASGCRPAGISANCSVPPAGFVRPDQLRATFEPPLVNTIRIDASGAIFWNGTRIKGSVDKSSYDRLDEYLAIIPGLTPQFVTTIVFRKGVPCASVVWVRRLMERRLSCSRIAGLCVQGEMPGETG